MTGLIRMMATISPTHFFTRSHSFLSTRPE
jgi:hypothetical protein